MKVSSHNIQGLNNPDKLRAFWKWLLSNDVDVACVQEHKLHDQAGKIQHCNGFTLLYGGKHNQYSGTLTIVKNKLCPSLLFNHDNGRVLGVQVVSEFGPLTISNIYGPNSALPRGVVWDYLAQVGNLEGIVCGDFNMVVHKDHSATRAALMQAGERSKWENLQATHTFLDAWSGKTDKGFTYHSQAYKNAWSRLDRIYIINTAWCPPSMDIIVDYANNL